MKRIVACSVVLCAAASARADLAVGNVATGFTTNVERFSDSGADLGPLGQMDVETLINVAVDANGNVFGTGNLVGHGVLAKLTSPGAFSVSPPQYNVPSGSDIEFGWNGRLFATSQKFTTSGLTGVLELNPATGAFIQNAIPYADPVSGSSPVPEWLGFDPGEGLYVGAAGGTSSGSTLFYSLDRSGKITLDTSFSIAAAGPMHFRPGDDTVFMAIGSSVIEFDPITGNQIGTFLTDSAFISDFTFAPDNSVYVLNEKPPVGSAEGGTVDHFSAGGSFLGTTVSFSQGIGGFGIAYIPVPEAASLGAILPAMLLLWRRRRAAMQSFVMG